MTDEDRNLLERALAALETKRRAINRILAIDGTSVARQEGDDVMDELRERLEPK